MTNYEEPRMEHAPISWRIRRRSRLRQRRREEGMTLVEIMIVVIIMALLATGVAVLVLPQLDTAKEEDTRAGAQQIRSAAMLYMADHNDCPSVDDLVEDELIDANRRITDGWDNPFTIECEGHDIRVISAGQDGEMGTEDDIQ